MPTEGARDASMSNGLTNEALGCLRGLPNVPARRVTICSLALVRDTARPLSPQPSQHLTCVVFAPKKPMNTPTKPNSPVLPQRKVEAFAASAFLLLLCPVVLAQQVTPTPTSNPGNREGEVVKLEAFSVTGSNIKRIEQEKTQPLTTLRAEQFEIMFNKTKYDSLPAKMRAIIDNAVEAASADMSWKAVDRYSKDYVELQTKQNVKFYKTPTSVLQSQLDGYDATVAKKVTENPMFKEIIASQKTFAERAVKWDLETNVDRRMAFNHYFAKKPAAANKS